jgi:hypothetical protein
LNTLEIAKIRGDHREKENKLNDTIRTLTSDKAKEIKAKEDMQKTLDDMKKELAELR